MVQPPKTAAEKQAALAKAQAEEEARIQAERHRRDTDKNYNPLLANGITNKDVSKRALYAHT